MENKIEQQKAYTHGPAIPLWLGGIGFTMIIAVLGYGLAVLPGFNRIGPMACAIFMAVLYRQLFGYPVRIRKGIQFSSKKLLRFAIILYGLKLNIGVILDQGLSLLVKDAIVIIFAVTAMVWLGKRFKADPAITFLLGAGTGICGAAAIAVVSSIIKSKEEDTAMSVGIIALTGTVFAITYTILRPFLPLTPEEYGIWSGLSLHEIAHVTLAGAPAGADGLAMALVAKLGRVLLLIPFALILVYFITKKHEIRQMDAKIEFPWFLAGFIAMSLVGSYISAKSIPLALKIMDGISSSATFLMTAAMVGLGLNINLRDLRQKALVPVMIIFIVSITLSVITFFMI